MSEKRGIPGETLRKCTLDKERQLPTQSTSDIENQVLDIFQPSFGHISGKLRKIALDINKVRTRHESVSQLAM